MQQFQVRSLRRSFQALALLLLAFSISGCAGKTSSAVDEAVIKEAALAPLNLTVTAPAESQSASARITGETLPGAAVTVNGNRVTVAADGTFVHEQILSAGENELEVVADLEGHEQAVERVVISRVAASIERGRGWGIVRLGASQDQIAEVFGEPDTTDEFDDTMFAYYEDLGLYINYSKPGLQVKAVFFQSGRSFASSVVPDVYSPFDGTTDTGIGWSSSVSEVRDKYGKPQEEYATNSDGVGRLRLDYGDISFRFEDGELVEISVD